MNLKNSPIYVPNNNGSKVDMKSTCGFAMRNVIFKSLMSQII